jgi:hypothetical protein
MSLTSTIRNLLRPPPAEALAAQELDSARRSLLEAHSAREYADAMVRYHTTRIARLRATLAEKGEPDDHS